MRCERKHFNFRYRSAAHFVQIFRDYYGPTHKAFGRSPPAGQQALEADLLALLGKHNTAGPRLAGGPERVPRSRRHQGLIAPPLQPKENLHETQDRAQVRQPRSRRLARFVSTSNRASPGCSRASRSRSSRWREGRGQGQRRRTPAIWIASFQADKIVVTLKIGNDVQVVGEFELGNVVDAKRRKQIADSLKDEGILDGSEVAQFMRRHPDKSRLAELRQAVADKLKAIETLKNELMTLKAELAGSGG